MENIVNKISFWKHLQESNITIPIIQRGYAQGREDKSELRKAFLFSIKKALDEDKLLVLDFIYGNNISEKFQPLDGQQRLTTLWLLHWFMTLKVNKDRFQLQSDFAILKKFTYETRITSREFFEELCNPNNFEKYNNKGNESLSDYITNQTWYYSKYNQDQTVLGILNMLSCMNNDSIQAIFRGDIQKLSGYYDKLFNLDLSKCPVVYNKLDLENFGLSDDLYIKMNARGKQLTGFENFKAEIDGLIRDKKEANSDNENQRRLGDERDGFAIKIDTDYMSIFWNNFKDSSNVYNIGQQVDDSFFKFILGLYFTKLIQNTDLSSNTSTEIYKYLSDSPEMKKISKASYLDFLKYGGMEIDNEFLCYLSRVLDNLSKVYPSLISNDDFTDYNESFNFILNSMNDSYGQIGKILLAGFAKYFYQGEYEPDSFKQWKRFLFNISLVTDSEGKQSLRDIGLVKTALDLINNDKIDSHNLHNSLRIFDSNILSQSGLRNQLEEEIEKAKKRAEKGWGEKIEKAENFAFFNGSIRFLFRNENGQYDWSKFDEKLKRAKELFDSDGLKGDDSIKAKTIRGFVTSCDKWEQIYDKEFFLNAIRAHGDGF